MARFDVIQAESATLHTWWILCPSIEDFMLNIFKTPEAWSLNLEKVLPFVSNLLSILCGRKNQGKTICFAQNCKHKFDTIFTAKPETCYTMHMERGNGSRWKQEHPFNVRSGSMDFESNRILQQVFPLVCQGWVQASGRECRSRD